jgi:hypothetical protein
VSPPSELHFEKEMEEQMKNEFKSCVKTHETDLPQKLADIQNKMHLVKNRTQDVKRKRDYTTKKYTTEIHSLSSKLSIYK